MWGTELSETDDETWTFEVEGPHLDACQLAKKKVADENDLDYRDLRARIVNRRGIGSKYVTVIKTF